MNIYLSGVVRAHPRRRDYAETLSATLNIPIVWDEHNNELETFSRCLTPNHLASHHLIIEDDAIATPSLFDHLARIIARTPDSPISPYLGRVRPEPVSVTRAYGLAQLHNAHLLRMAGPLWGVAVVHPVTHLPALRNFYATSSSPTSDIRVYKFYRQSGVPTIYPLSSLVDHRPSATSPSLLLNTTKAERVAHDYDPDPNVDWAATPMFTYTDKYLILPTTADSIAVPAKVTYRHKLSGRKKEVWAKGLIRDSLEMSESWELVKG